MNFTALIQGFCSYLESLNQISNKEYNTQNGKASVFMYSSEFKNYLENELNSNVKIESMSVNDILKMDIVNGKLIEEENDNEIPAGEKHQDGQLPQEEPVAGEQQESQTPQEEPVAGEQTPENEFSNDNASVTDIINNFLENKEVKNVIDYDKDGNISQEEMNTFINKVNSYDNDSENISVDDLMAAAQAIQEGTFGTDTTQKPSEKTSEDTSEKTTDDTTKKPEETVQKPDHTTSEDTSSDDSSGKSHNSSSSGGNDYSNDTNNSNTEQKNLENMTKEELNSELTRTQSDLATKQNELSAILDGTAPEIKALEEKETEAYNSYKYEVAKVDEDMAKQLDEYKQAVDKKEQEISQKEQEINNQETIVSDCENTYNNAVSNRENLESILSSLNEAAKDATEEQSADIQAKISQVTAELSAAKEAEQTAKEKWDAEKEKLEALNKEKEELQTGENGLDALNKQLSDYEAEIATKYPEIADLQKAWDDAKTELNTQKETSTVKAKEAVCEAQKEVNKVKDAIQNYDNKEKEKEHSVDPKNLYDATLGEQLAQIANNTDGTVGYCLRGVAKSVKKWLGERTELSNLGSAYMAAEALRNDPVLSQHFKEVEVDRSELTSLPPGAIVVWDRGAPNASAAGKKHGHISIALGNGKESSDHIQNQMTNRQSQFWVFYPVA